MTRMRVEVPTKAKNLNSRSRVPRDRSSVAVSTKICSVVTSTARLDRCVKMRRAAACSFSSAFRREKKPLVSNSKDSEAIHHAVDFLICHVTFRTPSHIVFHVENGVVWRDLIGGGLSRCDHAHSLAPI